MIDRDALIVEILRREGEFLINSGDYGEEGWVARTGLDHEGVANFVIEMIQAHTFVVQEQP